MAKYTAASALEPLEFDFRDITAANEKDQAMLDDAHGVIPEPTSRQVRHMQAVQRGLLQVDGDTSPEELVKLMAARSEQWWFDHDEEALDMIADVCNGSPSREQIAALPWRHQQGFYGWLLQEVVNPTVGTATPSRPTLVPMKSG